MGKTLDKKCLPRSLRGGSGGLRAKIGRRAATEYGENETDREDSAVAASGLFLLRGSCCRSCRWRGGPCGGRGLRDRWRARGGWSGRGGLSVGRILGGGRGIVEGGGVLEDAAGIFGDGLHAGSIGRIRSLDPTVIGADGFVNVAAEMIEQATEQQAGIGSEHGVIHGIQVQVARRPQAGRQQGVIALVMQVKLMGGAEGFTRDLPGAHGVVADHDTLATTAENDVVALGALLPDGVSEIAVNVHVVVLHGTDAEEVIKRKRIKLGDIENVSGELSGLLAR